MMVVRGVVKLNKASLMEFQNSFMKMVLTNLEKLKMGNSMALEHLLEKVVTLILVSSRKVTLMVMAFTITLVEQYIMDNSRMIKGTDSD